MVDSFGSGQAVGLDPIARVRFPLRVPDGQRAG